MESLPPARHRRLLSQIRKPDSRWGCNSVNAERAGDRLIFLIMGARSPDERRELLSELSETSFAAAPPDTSSIPPQLDGFPFL